MNKLAAFDGVVQWFGEGLHLPLPWLMAVLAICAEIGGGIALIFGIGLRFMAVPMMFTMIVAAATVHWQNGWHVLPESQLTVPWEWRTDLIEEGQVRKDAANEILEQSGMYDWLTEAGNITVLKNGIEFVATYFCMLVVLFFYGAGRFVSVDYWIDRKLSALERGVGRETD